MSDENQKENGLNSKDEKKGEAPKKKKLAVVFHSQNSANHKNHPLGGKLSTAKEQGARKTQQSGEQKAQSEKPKKTSPNGRPLPPGTARVTPLRELNEIQKRQAEEEARREAERKAQEEEQRRKAAEEAKREAERKAQEEARLLAERRAREDVEIIELLVKCRRYIEDGDLQEAYEIIQRAHKSYPENLRLEAFEWNYLRV